MSSPAWQGALVVVLAGLAYDALLATVRRVDRTYPDGATVGKMRWLGYARDASNLVGFLLFLEGFLLLGFPGPLAGLAAALVTLALYGLDFWLARSLALPRPAVVFGAVVTVLAGVVTLGREPIGSFLGDVVTRLYA